MSSINISDEDVWDDTALVRAYDKAIAQLKEEEDSTTDIGTDINVASSSQPNQSHTTKSNKGKKRKKKSKKNKRPRKKWNIGEPCLALYEEDGLYYEAVVESIDNEHCSATVKFSFYDNEEIVNFDQLLPVHNKERMNIAWNPNDIDNDNETNTEEEESEVSCEWKVSDIVYVRDHSGFCQQAVLNSFISPTLCQVTLIRSKQKLEVRTSQLSESLNDDNSYDDSTHYDPRKSSFMDNPMHIPPPPPFSNLPDLASPSFTNKQHNTNNFFSSSFSNCNHNSQDEALSNMLMSWYMSGYHTGYYQGLHHSSKESSFVGRKRKNRHKGFDRR